LYNPFILLYYHSVIRKMDYKTTAYVSVFPGYQKYSVSKPFFHTDLRSTLETVLVKEEPREERDS